MKNELLKQQIELLPDKPGVYIFKGDNDRVIYVGKALSLRNRVKSYFQTSTNLTPKTQRMVGMISDFEYIVTASEQEAFIFECNLIKRYRPNFNVNLRDDKTFPYLKIDNSNGWSRIYPTRRLVQDGSRYFGPFTSMAAVKQSLNMTRKIFPFRTCSLKIDGKAKRPCMYYFLQQCSAPCTGKISAVDYGRTIKQVIQFLEGRQESVVRELRRKMDKAAENLEFEKAARIRDQIQAIERVIAEQKVSSIHMQDMDMIAVALETNFAVAQVFLIRNGKLIGREHFVLQGTQGENKADILTGFIKHFYSSAPIIPRKIAVEFLPQEVNIIEEWLSKRRNRKVTFYRPVKGIAKRLLETVAENARQSLEQVRFKNLSHPEVSALALTELKQKLGLKAEPRRIEGYDISNIQGNMAVGSMVVFEGGIPKPKLYRRFSIKTVAGADDYAMLREILSRRFKRTLATDEPEDEKKWSVLPDLLLVDGGKGQLSTANEVLKACNVNSVYTISLAKEEEQIFTPESSLPLPISRSSPMLHLLQQVRDEAHRFALGYHRLRRKKETIASLLDNIPGIGPKRKRSLLRAFGSVNRIREADISDIALLKGITFKLAEKIKQYLYHSI